MKQSSRPFALRASARLTLTVLAVSTFTANATEPLDPITVTANRMPSENVLASTTVISRSDIERLQITDLPSLLSRQSGIDIATSGGIGQQSSIFMRGTNSSHVLVLVDGVKWYSATAGSPAIQDFPVEQIERIEIVRGPRSGLYGGEAIGGVIQIFTRKGQRGFTPYANVSYGTHDTKKATLGISGGGEKTSYNAGFSHQSTEGISALSNDVITNQDDDGYRNNSLNLNLSHELHEKVSVELGYIRAEAYTEYDQEFNGFFAANAVTEKLHTETEQQVISSKLAFQISDNWLSNIVAGESRDQSESFTDNVSSFIFNTRHRYVSLNNIVNISDTQTLNVGLDYDVDHVDGTTDFVDSSRDNKAVFASWQGSWNQHNWLLSARHDDNEAFGGHNTGTAEWGYRINDELQLIASVGTGFKTPTFNDLYFPLFWGYQGNPDLDPERSRSYELSLVGNNSFVDWSIRAYETKISDLIFIKSDFSTVENINKARIQGLELDIETEVFGWIAQANMSFLRPEDEQTGKVLARRAKRLASFQADKQWGDFSAGASWKLTGHRFDNASNSVRMGGYGLVDLRAAYQVDKDWSAQLSVSNVFDKEYQTVNTYNSLDRTAMLTISYKP